jgi:predicted transcriptional regulator
LKNLIYSYTDTSHISLEVAFMEKPFEGILGNSCELRTIEFLLPLNGMEFNVTELAEEVGVSWPTAQRVVSKFVDWGMMKVAQHRGGVAYYEINKNSHFVTLLEKFNNSIIEHMLDEQTLYEIGDYWKRASSSSQPSVETAERRTIVGAVQPPSRTWLTDTPIRARPIASFPVVMTGDVNVTQFAQRRPYERASEGPHQFEVDKVIERRAELLMNGA